MRLELPTLLPAPGGITLGAGSRCGLEGAEHCGVVAALGVAGGAAAGSPPARSWGRLCRATSTALGAGLGIFPSLDFMGLLLAPSSHVQRSEQQLCCNTWAWGGTDPCSPSCSGNPTLVPPLGRAFTSMLRAAKCQSVEPRVLVAPWPAPARHRPCWDTPRSSRCCSQLSVLAAMCLVSQGAAVPGLCRGLCESLR